MTNMDQDSTHQLRATRRQRMVGRDTTEARSATPLELFFDLAFVVAIAFAARELHHGIVVHHYVEATLNFLSSFFAIWWAWMNFTWFASAYDTDDVPFRLLTMLQMSGVVLMAVGIAETGGGMGNLQLSGYVVMRLALVSQWLRVAREDERCRATARRYAAGITIMQLYWVGAVLALPQQVWLAGMIIGAAGEILVPRIAERAGATPWHPHHIAERFGLLVIIVLGEGVLGMTNAVAGSLDKLGWTVSLSIVAPSAILILLGCWWVYFLAPYGERLAEQPEKAFFWGYAHYLIFASLAALGAGLEVVETAIVHPEDVTSFVAACSVAVPMAIFLATIGLVHRRMWTRERWYSVMLAGLFALLGAIAVAARAGLEPQLAIAALALVPATMVVVAELRGARVTA